MAQIEYYFSTLSPFTYFAGDTLERLAAKHGATIVYKPTDLIRAFDSTGGLPLGKRHPARLAYRMQELKRIAKRTGMPIVYEPKFFPTNYKLSTAACCSAVRLGGGDVGKLAQNILTATWRDDLDIADQGVIDAAATDAGFDPAALLADREAGMADMEANTDEAIERGVFGSPFYLVDGVEMFWGQDRLDYLADHLAEGA
ncbi:MAG: 2-hydroxychromene-2-carboxylate isomerase [Pseudomonadota bacterium]